MRMHRVVTRFAPLDPGGRPGTSVLDERIADLRKLLRTDMDIPAIAEILGVSPKTVRTFVRRRAICDLEARRLFNGRKRGIGMATPIDMRSFKAGPR